jgi:hypothetical protein
MGFLTLKVRAAGGGLAYETDFTLQELIPLVRHLTRRLEGQPELAARLAGYRVVVTPGYDRPAAPAAPPVAAQPLAGGPSGEALPVLAAGGAGSVSFAAEVEAFFSPGTSSLCASCPERQRCPGSGRAAAADLDGWIVLDPEAPRTNRPVRHFAVRFETAGGELLHRQEVSLEPLQPFVMMVSSMLRRAGRLAAPVRGHLPAEIIARHDGRPAIDPMLAPAERARLLVQFLNLPEAWGETQEPPETLVDWDRLEQEDPEIQLLASESEALPPRPPPPADGGEAVGSFGQDELLIYVRRAVLAALRTASRSGGAEIEGLLTGQAFLVPEVGRPWIEIASMVPVAPGRGSSGEPAPGVLDLLGGRPSAGGQGGRTVGWFRSHRIGEFQVARQDGRRLILSLGEDRLAPTRDERFFHRHFFAEPWHVGLIVDGQEEGERFYRRQGEDLVACAGFLLLD